MSIVKGKAQKIGFFRRFLRPDAAGPLQTASMAGSAMLKNRVAERTREPFRNYFAWNTSLISEAAYVDPLPDLHMADC
jgi:hypothetical protein